MPLVKRTRMVVPRGGNTPTQVEEYFEEISQEAFDEMFPGYSEELGVKPGFIEGEGEIHDKDGNLKQTFTLRGGSLGESNVGNSNDNGP